MQQERVFVYEQSTAILQYRDLGKEEIFLLFMVLQVTNPFTSFINCKHR